MIKKNKIRKFFKDLAFGKLMLNSVKVMKTYESHKLGD